ncbi:CoA transferase [Streptomyces melanosporofaciens]|uniref:CoA transferase n=1 Tax=Streptomyces melanosporofaciens TaxID=67327 RepID=UPI003CC7A5C8
MCPCRVRAAPDRNPTTAPTALRWTCSRPCQCHGVLRRGADLVVRASQLIPTRSWRWREPRWWRAVATGRAGARPDISQRELAAWTLVGQLAAYVWEGLPILPIGNRRPGAPTHDVYPSVDKAWLAVACTTDGHSPA